MNVLVRVLVHDDAHQARAAERVLQSAEVIAIPLPCLCELVWVLRRLYRLSATDVSDAIKRLLSIGSVVVDRPAVEAGLSMMDAGGDFADGVIAYAGRWIGGEVFLSFDRRAVALLTAQGSAARLLR